MAGSKVLAKVQGRIGLERKMSGSLAGQEAYWQHEPRLSNEQGLSELLGDTRVLIGELLGVKKPSYGKSQPYQGNRRYR